MIGWMVTILGGLAAAGLSIADHYVGGSWGLSGRQLSAILIGLLVLGALTLVAVGGLLFVGRRRR